MCLKSIKGDIRHLEFSKCPILSKSQLLMWWVTFPTIKRTRIQLTSCFEVALVTYFLWLKLWGDLTINRFHSLKPWFAKDWKRANGWMSKSCAKEMVIILSSVGFENCCLTPKWVTSRQFCNWDLGTIFLQLCHSICQEGSRRTLENLITLLLTKN